MMNTFVKTVLAASVGSLLTIGTYELIHPRTSANVSVSDVPAQTARYYLPEGELNFVPAAEKVTPAVVHIKATFSNKRPTQQMLDPFKDFFGDGFDQFFERRGGDPQQKQQGSGSGVIINANGFIVTNNHVIEDAEEVEVSLSDKRTLKAQVIGTDPSTDLALIKIDDKDLPFLEMANSDEVKVGQWVLAVGNPFNLESTVTAGIVSAKGRSINILRNKDRAPVESFIQTDAAINPGNSGGALVNLQGQLIGVNTAIASNTGSYAGYGFAVPTKIVNKVVEDLMKYGKVQRAFLGISITTLDSKLAEEKGIGLGTGGVYVQGVQDEGAAKVAGIEAGDVITKVNGKTVKSVPELQEIIASYRPNEKIKLQYLRDGKEKTAEVVLKNSLGTTDLASAANSQVLQKLGADLEALSETERKETKINAGVKINKLYSGKLRSETDIREGFVITKANKKPIRTVAELEKVLQEAENEGEGVLLEGKYPNDSRSYFFGLGL